MADEHDAGVKGARIILETCLGLQKHETFLLIYDETTRDLVPVFEKATRSARIQFRRAYVSKNHQASGPEAFRSHLLRSLTGAHGVLVATTDDEQCTNFRIVLTGEKRQAGSAMATMPGSSLKILSTAMDVNYGEIISRCRDLTLPLIKGTRCTIHSFDSDGNRYILELGLAGPRRPPIQSYGIIPRQAWGNVPAGETFVAPLETSATGQYLVSGAVGTEKIAGSKGALLTFKNGRLTEHHYVGTREPVAYLSSLKRLADLRGHGACWSIIAEFGVGVNKSIKALTGVQLVDEKKYGTVHIAIGHNSGYGGTTQCGSVHCDMTTVNPTVLIDGTLIIDRGEHITNFDQFKDNYLTFAIPPDRTWREESKFVTLHEDSYDLDQNRMLWVKKRTSSGRQTIYAIGDETTSRLAHDVVTLFQSRTVIEVERIKHSLSIPEPDCLRLLSLLYSVGIISP